MKSVAINFRDVSAGPEDQEAFRFVSDRRPSGQAVFPSSRRGLGVSVGYAHLSSII